MKDVMLGNAAPCDKRLEAQSRVGTLVLPMLGNCRRPSCSPGLLPIRHVLPATVSGWRCEVGDAARLRRVSGRPERLPAPSLSRLVLGTGKGTGKGKRGSNGNGNGCGLQ